jgi:hypothetical protein
MEEIYYLGGLYVGKTSLLVPSGRSFCKEFYLM